MMMQGRTTADWGALLLLTLFVLALTLFIGPGAHSDKPASNADAAADELARVAVTLTAAHDQKARSTVTDDDIPPVTKPVAADQPLHDAALAPIFWAPGASITTRPRDHVMRRLTREDKSPSRFSNRTSIER